MNSLFKLFKKSIFDSFEERLDEMKKSLAELKERDFEKDFENLATNFQTRMDNLKKKWKNLNDRYTFEVPYDRDTQILKYEIKNNKLNVTVTELVESDNSSFSSESIRTVTIPEDADVYNISQKYDKENKKMVFIVKKNFIETEEAEEEPKEAEETNETSNVQHEDETVNCEDERNVQGVAKPFEECSKSEQLEIILGLYSNGWSFRRIAKEVGLSDKTVAKWIRQTTNQ